MRPAALALAFFSATAISSHAQQRLLPLDAKVYRQVLASNHGKVVLVDLWATWCAPCLEELPLLVKLERKYRAKGFRLVTVSCDEPEDAASAAELLNKERAPLPGYLKQVENDEAFINSIDPKWSGALPALFLYDRNGKLVKSFVGEADMAEVEKAVQELLL